MRRYQTYFTATACALCLSLVTAGAFAQQTKPQERQRQATERRDAATQKNTASQRQATNRRSQAGQLDEKMTGANIRASQLIGMNIQNSAGESVGEINDIVFDGSSGRVRYAAVTYGGFLGVGNKMFAVPFEAFKVQANPDDRQEHILVLNVTQKQLEGATGFSEDSWPNFADKTMARDLDKRYNIDRKAMRTRNRNANADADVEIDVDREGVNVDENKRKINN